jgi:hypothetical protein
MVTEERISEVQNALIELHKSLETSKFKRLNLTEFCKKYKIGHFVLYAMFELDYIQKKGHSYKWKYKFKLNKTAEPLDARRVIETASSLRMNQYKKRKETRKPLVQVKQSKVTVSKELTKYMSKKRQYTQKPTITNSKCCIYYEKKKSYLWGLFKYSEIQKK